MKYPLSLFIFRRDLRLTDNIGLITALKESKLVLPCFIFDPRQCLDNPYKSSNALQFMLESLQDLEKQLEQKSARLFYFDGVSEKVVETIIKKYKIAAVYFNKDYTPFSQYRDQNIKLVCAKHHCDVFTFDDALLIAPDLSLKADGTPYKVFTSFYKNSLKFPVQKPIKNNFKNFATQFKMPKFSFKKILAEYRLKPFVKGGRKECQQRLAQLGELINYKNERDYPAKDATSHLSAYMKFTNCSVREIYYAIKNNVTDADSLIRELYWRDFFSSIAFYFPHVFGKSFYKKYDRVAWKNNEKLFKAWCQGKTGFPIVDAGMRQLNQTGYMHNRLRLITASFLVKDLHIHWLRGEQYFAQKLIDYDPAVNNGNWQWVAGTGVDAQPYFRIFNPWLQQKKFDNNCVYIKTWLPELSHLENKIIHHWYEASYQQLASYPKPIVDHAQESLLAKRLYNKD